MSCKQTNAVKDTGVVYCSRGNPSSFNPQLAQTESNLDISAQLYSTLVRIDPNTQMVIPGLAKSWQMSRDGLRYRFTLRQGIQFHATQYFTPTRALNADDVLFSFNRILDPLHPYFLVSGGDYPFFNNTQFPSLIKAIRKLGPYQVEFELNYPDTSLLANLATEFAVILSAQYGKQLIRTASPEQIDQLPIGTGPFKLKDFKPDHMIRFERHWGYWEGGAPMQQLVFDITAGPTQRLAKLITGECDAMAFPAASQVNMIANHEDLLLSAQTGSNVAVWAFNTQQAPFDQPNVRRALAAAVDRSTILRAVYYNTGVLANSILPPTSWAYNPNVDDYQYAPIKAKQLLQQADISDPLKLTIHVTSTGTAYNPNGFKTAEFIQADLRKIGVEAEIIVVERHQLATILAQGNYQTVITGWNAVTSDPDNFFRAQLSCQAIKNATNASQWCDPTTDGLIQRGIKQSRMVPRIRIYRELQQHVQQEMPLLPLAHSLKFQSYRKDIQGLTTTDTGGINFSGVFRN